MVNIPAHEGTGYCYTICQLDKASGNTGAFVYHPSKPNIAISKVYGSFQELVDMLFSIQCRVFTGSTQVFWENPHHD